MLKTAIVSLNVFALLALKFILGGEVSVEQKMPEQIEAGETFTVEITINKSDHEGFAKWQQQLPEGFIASMKDVKGATFSFKKQEVKIIWMALPKKENVTVSYKIKTDPTLKGSYTLDGKFSYLEENERKDIMVEGKTIKIGSAGDQLSLNENSSESDENNSELSNAEVNPNASDKANERIRDIKETNDDDNQAVAELVLDEDDVKIYRQIKHLQDANYLVSLKIEKGNISSFGKIEEYIPEGFIVTEEKNEQGIFSFNKQVMKILWMTIPTKSTINVSYNLESTSDLLDRPMIHGVFSYLDEAESVQKELKASTFTNYFQAEESLANEDSNDQTNSKQDNESLAEKSNVDAMDSNENGFENESNASSAANDMSSASANGKASDEDLVQSITDIPSPETSISYKVQIAAGKKEVKPSYFKSRHNITETVSIEYHNNWYKYTLGKYGTYKSARDKRNQIWEDNNKINDAFVTAYNAGERISVQEALMISKQKWYK